MTKLIFAIIISLLIICFCALLPCQILMILGIHPYTAFLLGFVVLMLVAMLTTPEKSKDINNT